MTEHFIDIWQKTIRKKYLHPQRLLSFVEIFVVKRERLFGQIDQFDFINLNLKMLNLKSNFLLLLYATFRGDLLLAN